MSHVIGNHSEEELYDNDEEDNYDNGFAADMEALRQACLLTGTNFNNLNNNNGNENNTNCLSSSTARGADRNASNSGGMADSGNHSEEELYDSDEEDNYDDGFAADMEALRQACLLTGTNFNNLNNDNGNENNTNCPSSSAAGGADRDASGGGGMASESDSEDDAALLRNIRNRFSALDDLHEPLLLKPICSLPPVSDEEDDFETLCSVRRRFAAYDNSDALTKRMDNITKQTDCVQASSASMEIETLNDLSVDRTSNQAVNATDLLTDNMESQTTTSIEQHQSDACFPLNSGLKYSSFPKSAQLFIDAIKRNRSCQKFIRGKLTHIEARIEENKKLKERVKLLKDFQVSCKKITGRALSQKKDPCIQLISSQRTLSSKDLKVDDKRVFAMQNGPVENSHVANYREALSNYPILLKRKKWDNAEKQNLGKGIKQQFQEMLLQLSVDRFSGSEGSPGDANNLDTILTSIRDLEITPENIREFLPKVNWDQLASLYVKGRTGAECEARWLNFEDPMINSDPWTIKEDKKLLYIVQEKGISNWFDIAVSLGTNRTPSQCLTRFQRSLNARILKREWTADEDAQLRNAVETFGESNWQAVASALGGRTGTQCSNRWNKSIHPDRKKAGTWTLDEDKHLKVAVKLFGAKNWKKIAHFVSGRTHVQCRERWVNNLDPSLKLGEWTEEEDLKLKAALQEFGYRWSKVATCLPGRTDSDCRRRWKVLFPHEVPLLQVARRMEKAALIGNFVDRESERPALDANDFIPTSMIGSLSRPENVGQSREPKRKSRRGPEPKNGKNATPGNALKKFRSKTNGKILQTKEATGIINGTNVESVNGDETAKCLQKPSRAEQAQDLASDFISMPIMITNGEGSESKRGKRCLEEHSEGNIAAEADGNNQSLLLPSQNEELQVRAGNGFQDFCGTDKQECMRTRTSSEDGSCILPESATNDTNSVHDQLYSNLLTSSNDKEDHIPGLAGASSKKRVLMPNSIRKMCTILDETTKCSISPPESLELTEIAMGNVGKSSFGRITSNLESKEINLYQRRKRSVESSGQVEYVASIPCQNDRQERSKPSANEKSCSTQVLGMENEDNLRLASCIRNNSKKRRHEVAETADQAWSPPTVEIGFESISGRVDQSIMQTAIDSGKEPCITTVALQEPMKHSACKSREDEDETGEITLASFLHKNGKKIATRVDHLKTRNKMSSSLVWTAVASDKEHCSRTGTPQKVVKEQACINLKDELETGDITIASLIQNKQKKRRHIFGGSIYGTPTLSHLKEGSKLPSNGLEHCNDRISDDLSSKM